MTEGTVAFRALPRSGLAPPARPAVAPWAGPGATPVNCARWPTPVSPWVREHRRARPGTQGVVFAMGGTLRPREGEGLPWVTQHLLGSSSAVPLSRSPSAIPSCKHSVFLFTCFLSRAANIESSSVSHARGWGHSAAHWPTPINQWSRGCGSRAILRVCLRLSHGRGEEEGKGSFPRTRGLHEVLKDE